MNAAKKSDKSPTDLGDLERILGIEFKDKDLLATAMTHRSYLNEHPEYELDHNERLEFLGDAVLELLVSKRLFDNYPDYPEGDLTSFRAATVRTETLASTSRKLQYGKFLKMSKGEEATGGRDREYILANAFEAVLGAIYLDQGLEVSKKFLDEHHFNIIPEIVKNRLDVDSKSKLQEVAQEVFKETPTYEVIKETGPDHEKVFIMEVKIGKEAWAKGKGTSKQEAEENAAEKALKRMKTKKVAKLA